MRLFIAVDLPKEIKDELFRVQKLISPSLAKIKWVSKKNLHLTLKFIGETDVDAIEISKKLKRIRFKPIKAELFEFGAFPTKYSGYVRVLWVGVRPKEEIIELQQSIDSELLKLFKQDQKFSPHLTLGRVKMIKRKDEFLSVLKGVKVNPIKFEIGEFKLMESRLNKDGPVYSIVKSFKA